MNLPGMYILGPDGRTAIRCIDVMTWARWMEQATRTVALTQVGDARISTVFLGIDHGWMRNKPWIFETMVFGGEHNDLTEQYSTWEEAEAGHAAVVEMVKGRLKNGTA